MRDIEFYDKEARKFIERATDFAKDSDKTARYIAEGISMKMTANARQKDVIGATGKLVQRIGAYKLGRGYEVMSKVPYSIYVEAGTRPHYVNPNKLKAWARKKLGNENLAYAVAKAIAKRGTRARKFVSDTYEWAQKVIDKKLSKLLNLKLG